MRVAQVTKEADVEKMVADVKAEFGLLLSSSLKIVLNELFSLTYTP